MNPTVRQLEIVGAVQMTGSVGGAAEKLGISKWRVYEVLRIVTGEKRQYPFNYKDTGCLDGKYPSCFECPLDKCRY